MNMGFYSAATSAYYQQQRLNVVANNSANINTVAYKAKNPTFSALLYSNFNGIDGPLSRGSGARMEKADTDFAEGAIYETNQPLDYALSGDGFFALRDMETGEVSYTRAGNFQMAQMGTDYFVTDSSGHRYVLDQLGQPIRAERNESGVIDPNAKLPLGVFTFRQKNNMQHLGDNRFLPVEKNGQPIAAENVEVMQGYLEGSNTNITKEFTKIIEAQRAYSYALAMVRTSDEVETTINGLRG
ncbi:MAG: flagellar hook-basal body protein [Butyricicoccus pullicaecorum]|nr:flagellar hook-basal body protein [Butyricicoccus pullicaecorum]